MPFFARPQRMWFVSAVAILFVIFAAELYLSARLESQTFDEPVHLYAGYSYWLRSDFGINPEHPPLVKLVASLPLLLDRPEYPEPPNTVFKVAAAIGGAELTSEPGGDAALASARVAVSAFAFALGLLVFLATREMFGNGAALLALLLFVFDPLILGHAPLLGIDMGAACCIFGSIFALYRYMRQPSLMRLGACCVATGLAFASKHSAILIFPIFAMLCVFEVFFIRGDSRDRFHSRRLGDCFRLASAYAAIVIAAIVILWAFYGFRYEARPDGKQLMPAPAVYLQGLHQPVEAGIIRFAEEHHLLPESYLIGLTDVALLVDNGRPMYLLGKVYPVGKWFYFPAAFLIKMTIGFLLLLALAPFARALWLRNLRRELLFLVLPTIVFFGSAMSAKLNIGIRHVLPAMPFLIVLVAGSAEALSRQSRVWRWAVAILVVLDVTSSLRAYPNYLPYSNEAFGGPERTYRVLADSNVGWGGGLKALHVTLARRNVTQCWFAYSMLAADPAHFQIPCKWLPTHGAPVSRVGLPVQAHIDGSVFISSEELTGELWGPGELNPYDQFLKLQPSRVIAGEIVEFDGSFDIPKIAAVSEWGVGLEHLRQGRAEEAIPCAQESIALDPGSLYGHEVLAAAYAAEQQYGAAESEYHVALHLYHELGPYLSKFVGPPRDPLARD
jgi:4-amino-4-deoxy-L-arabinose transferase-like glycosyltransferase